MRDDVRACVSARIDFFDKYFTVPTEMKSEVANFIAETEALGESVADSQEFEAKFVSTGLSDRFNSIIPKCTPKSVPVTEEQKAYSEQVRKEMWEEQKGQIAKDIVIDVAESAAMRAESDIMQARRRAMAEVGTLDEYTRASNLADDIEYSAGFFSKLFKKKK